MLTLNHVSSHWVIVLRLKTRVEQHLKQLKVSISQTQRKQKRSWAIYWQNPKEFLQLQRLFEVSHSFPNQECLFCFKKLWLKKSCTKKKKSRKRPADQMSHKFEKQKFARRTCRLSCANFARHFLGVTISALKVVNH